MQNIFKGFKQLNVCFTLQGFSIRGDELDDTVFLSSPEIMSYFIKKSLKFFWS